MQSRVSSLQKIWVQNEKHLAFSEWINGLSFSASCANFICFEHLELQQESEMHPYQRTKTLSSPKLYESMGVPSGVSQVGSSRPQNEPTGSSRSPKWKINCDQPTSRGIIPRAFSYQRWSRSVRFWIFSDSEKSRNSADAEIHRLNSVSAVIWGIPLFLHNEFSQGTTISFGLSESLLLFPASSLNHHQSVSPQNKREPSIC